MASGAVTVAAVALSFVWFARRGVGPLQLAAQSGTLWLAVAALLAAIAGLAWLMGRAMSGPRPPK